MISTRELFRAHLAQTSDAPLEIEISSAEGCVLKANDGKEYIDLISGISVSAVGHRHPKVIKAIKDQVDSYLHIMVYGEMILSPQVMLASKLAKHLPPNLSNVYFVNSGSEANEGAVKLAKRFTGRAKTVSFTNAYHGSTQGVLSLMGNEHYKDSFRPLIPGNQIIEFNNISNLEVITTETACVIAEPIQGEAGIIPATREFMLALRNRCTETGTLLILDEVQTGFGRTGSLFAFEQYDIKPDILTIAKAMGGGMPIGSFISSKEIMSSLTNKPALGHITTFGGHPVSCAASLATLNILLEEKIIENVKQKENAFIARLSKMPSIEAIRSKGLLIGVQLESEKKAAALVKAAIKNGILTDWFLFAPDCIRIAPPLTISTELINDAMDRFEKALKD